MRQKIQKKITADFPVSHFSFLALLTHWCQHWVKAASECFESFGAKSGASAVPQPSSLKIDLKALMLLFRTLYESFFGLE